MTTPTPAGAAATDSDTLVFVPFRGQTFGVVRNGVTTFPAYFGGGDYRGGEPFEGDFTGSAGTDVFVYRPGPDPDGIVKITPSGTTVTTSLIPKTVNGTFTPLVGDFDGNAISDILWYAPGSSPDALWLFDSSGAHANVPLAINGSYVPTVFEANGDGYDDIIWYAPGGGADSIWLFGAGAGHTTKAVSISGSYQLLQGYFGEAGEGSPQKRLLFFNPPAPTRSGPSTRPPTTHRRRCPTSTAPTSRSSATSSRATTSSGTARGRPPKRCGASPRGAA